MRKIIIVQKELSCSIFIMESLKNEQIPGKSVLLFPCNHEMIKYIEIESYDLIISDKAKVCDEYPFSIKYIRNEWGKSLPPELYYKIGVWEGILEEKETKLIS